MKPLGMIRSMGWLWAIALLGLAATTVVEARPALPDFTQLVKAYGPAVVNISTTQKEHTLRELRKKLPKGLKIPDIPEDSPLNEFFHKFFGEGGIIPDEPLESRSLGSGFFISPDGYILTNHHVVDDADQIIVRTSDRNEYVAKVIGSDKRSDVALLKVDAKNAPVVKIGTSKNLKVGEWVLAIGSPFGFDHSATAGIVSAKGRSLPSENYVPFIQTDVAINPGNSGGPLFNLDGEVVGINSQIYSRTGGFMGLSFAIPIDMAMHVVEQLKTKGRVTRGWLGVLIQDVSKELANSFGMSRPRGALVAQVLPDSPAAKSDLHVGDVIVAFNGHEISMSSELPPLVGDSPVDKPAELEVLRNGKQQKIRVVIGELPAEEDLASTPSKPARAKAGRLGLTVAPLSDEQREALKIPEGGVVVEEVGSGSAAKAGIKPGDVITMINNKPVKDVRQFKEIVKGLPGGRSVAVLVHRESGPMFLALRVPAK